MRMLPDTQLQQDSRLAAEKKRYPESREGSRNSRRRSDSQHSNQSRGSSYHSRDDPWRKRQNEFTYASASSRARVSSVPVDPPPSISGVSRPPSTPPGLTLRPPPGLGPAIAVTTLASQVVLGDTASATTIGAVSAAIASSPCIFSWTFEIKSSGEEII